MVYWYVVSNFAYHYFNEDCCPPSQYITSSSNKGVMFISYIKTASFLLDPKP